jgi:hypothetical protein
VSSRYVPIIVDALNRAGSPKAAEITRRAIDALGLSDVSEEAIESALTSLASEVESELDALGSAYASSRKDEDVMNNLLAFIRADRDSIRIPYQASRRNQASG